MKRAEKSDGWRRASAGDARAVPYRHAARAPCQAPVASSRHDSRSCSSASACNKAQRAGRNSLPLATAQPAAPAAKQSTLAGQVWATVNVSVPGGSVGEVHVPILSAESGLIKESGAAVWKDGAFAEPMPVGIKAVRSDGRFVVFETGAGRSSFTSGGAA